MGAFIHNHPFLDSIVVGVAVLAFLLGAEELGIRRYKRKKETTC